MSQTLRIGFIGAGDVNFGGGEGPWDHASRLEKIPGLQVVGVADPNTPRAEAQLARRAGKVHGPPARGPRGLAGMYAEAGVFADYRQMLERARPEAVWIGVPPDAHGTLEDGRDMERHCAAAGVHMFIEKPLSAFRPRKVQPVAEALAASGVIVSVGYMFRYHAAIEAMRELLRQAPGGPKLFSGRYNCAYSEIRKPQWWDVRGSGGPIVEQATHFVDLARYLVGDVELDTVAGAAIPGGSPQGRLVDAPAGADGRRLDESVPPEHRHPCVTAAVWKFRNGAVGSLVHGTLLHGRKYETAVEVWADGLLVELADPYGACRLRIRRGEQVEERSFADDDPYLAEDIAFVEAVRRGDASSIRCSYGDAFETFALTWAITDAAGCLSARRKKTSPPGTG